MRIGSLAIEILAVLIPLLALLFVLLFIIWWSHHKFSLLRKKFKNVKKEIHRAELVFRKAFYLLKDDVDEQIKMLEKTKINRQLTEEEKKIVERLKNDLDAVQNLIKEEFEDIEKEIK